MNARRLAASLFVTAIASLAASSARAEGVVSVGVGPVFVLDANFLGKPGDKTVVSGGRTFLDESYPGFSGFGAGAGAMVDLRFLSVVGLELDLLRTNDRAHGDINNATIDIGQAAWHLPILAKGTLPFGFVRPQVFVGPEFVFPSTGTAEVTGPLLTQVTEHASGTTLITFGLGAEFRLPIPGIDLRIPFQVRGSVNPSTSDKVSDRANYTLNGAQITAIDYRSEFQYRIAMNLGAAIYFP